MSRDVMSGIKRLLQVRSPTLKQLELSWFGGEPLLAVKEVCEISGHANALSRDYSYSYHSSMSTNGYLLGLSALEKLVEVGVDSFQISLDGTSDYHDLTRIDAAGRATHAKILHNLQQIKRSDLAFNILLRLHVTSQNYDSMPSLVRQIEKFFGDDLRFKAYFKSVEDLGGPGSSTGKRLKIDQDIQGLEALLPPRMLAYKEKTHRSVCYAAAGNSFVIRSTGDICKCTVALDNPANFIGKITNTGTIVSDPKKIAPWVSALFRPDDSHCPLISVSQ